MYKTVAGHDINPRVTVIIDLEETLSEDRRLNRDSPISSWFGPEGLPSKFFHENELTEEEMRLPRTLSTATQKLTFDLSKVHEHNILELTVVNARLPDKKVEPIQITYSMDNECITIRCIRTGDVVERWVEVLDQAGKDHFHLAVLVAPTKFQIREGFIPSNARDYARWIAHKILDRPNRDIELRDVELNREKSFERRVYWTIDRSFSRNSPQARVDFHKLVCEKDVIVPTAGECTLDWWIGQLQAHFPEIHSDRDMKILRTDRMIRFLYCADKILSNPQAVLQPMGDQDNIWAQEASGCFRPVNYQMISLLLHTGPSGAHDPTCNSMPLRVVVTKDSFDGRFLKETTTLSVMTEQHGVIYDERSAQKSIADPITAQMIDGWIQQLEEQFAHLL